MPGTKLLLGEAIGARGVVWQIKTQLCKPAFLSSISETHSEWRQPTPKSSSLNMAYMCPVGASTPSPIIIHISKINLDFKKRRKTITPERRYWC